MPSRSVTQFASILRLQTLIANQQWPARYMIDVLIHKVTYADKYPAAKDDEPVDFNSTLLSRDFLLLMPAEIYGFSMQTKRWGWLSPSDFCPTRIAKNSLISYSNPQSRLDFSSSMEHGSF